MVQRFCPCQSRTFNFDVLGASDEKSEQLPRKKDLARIVIRTSSVAMNRNKIKIVIGHRKSNINKLFK